MENQHVVEPSLSWRGIVLYGLNTATYKIALATCLFDLARDGSSAVPLARLAEAFFDRYAERLEGGKPQLVLPGRETAMERIVRLNTLGRVDREEAIALVARDAFGDVVPRFHTVAGATVPHRFYEATNDGLVLTDHLFALAEQADVSDLATELSSRWDLLEEAFAMRRRGGTLVNDIRAFYLDRGYERTSITHLRPVLHGYQQGRCFYCGEAIELGGGHVDHVLPRAVLRHDEVWNLVLAHEFCNEQKSDAPPGDDYVAKLVARNEDLIASNHPLREQLLNRLGRTEDERRRTVRRVAEDVRAVIPYTWAGIRGYHPETDPFYRAFVRSFAR